MDPFTPPPEDLPPVSEVITEFATIDAEAIAQAVEEWRKKPPDPKFEKLLDAAVVEIEE